METPQPITIIVYNEIISINIKNNEIEYKLILKSSPESIQLELIDSNIISGIVFENILNLNQLYQLNPYFRQFISIEKLIKTIKKFFENNEIKIKENNNDMNIFFNNPIDEDEKIYIPLNRTKKSEKILIKNLYDKMSKIMEENNEIKKEIEELKKDKNKMENKIDELNKNNEIMKINIEELNKDKEIKDNIILSLIIIFYIY